MIPSVNWTVWCFMEAELSSMHPRSMTVEYQVDYYLDPTYWIDPAWLLLFVPCMEITEIMDHLYLYL